MTQSKNILFEVQEYVADNLNEQLSASCTFLPENRRDIDFQIKQALGKQGIVGVVLTPEAEYIGNYEDKGIAWQINNLEVDVIENVTVNRGLSNDTGQDVSLSVFNILSQPGPTGTGKFNPRNYLQGEDSSLLVNKCTFDCAVYGDSTTPEPVVPYFAQPDSISVMFGSLDENGRLKNISQLTERTALVFDGLKAIDPGAMAAKFYCPDDDHFDLFGIRMDNISSVAFPTLETVGAYSFYKTWYINWEIKEVQWPNNVISVDGQHVGAGVFQQAFQLSELEKMNSISVDVSGSINSMFQSTFSSTNLASADITVKGKDISATYNAFNRSFQNARQLSSLTIHLEFTGSSRIESTMFQYMASGTNSLTSYTIDFSKCDHVPTLNSSSTFDAPSRKTCYVKIPASLSSEWMNANNWNSISATYVVE